MEAEYFPPKEDVVLQNETPTEIYLVVSGSMVKTKSFLISVDRILLS